MLPLADPNDPRLPPAAQAAMQARPIPLAAAPVAAGAPSAPQTDSRPIPQVAIPARATQDPTGQHPVQSSPIPKAAIPGAEQRQANLSHLENTGSGVSQIHNPFLRALGTVGDVIASGVFPNFGTFIPGTTAHHVMLTNQARNAVKGDTEQEEAATRMGLQRSQAEEAEADVPLKEAQAENQRSEANARNNPADKIPTTEIGLFLKDPAQFKAYKEASQKAQATKEPQFIKDGQGNIVGMVDEKGQLHSASDPELDPQAKAIMEAAKPKQATPTNITEFWLQKNPQGTPEELQNFLAKQPEAKELNAEDQAIIRSVGGDPSIPVAEQPIAILNKYLAKKKEPSPEKPPVVMVPGPGGTMIPQVSRFGVPLPHGTLTAGGMNTEQVNEDKQAEAEKKAVEDNRKTYQLAQQFAAHPTGPNDVALTMQFIGAVKPESMGKIRFTPQEQNFVIGARSAFGDLDAFLNKVVNGQKLTTEQRQQMLETMRIMANPGGEAGSSPNARPTATDAKGNKVEYDGKAWVPVQKK